MILLNAHLFKELLRNQTLHVFKFSNPRKARAFRMVSEVGWMFVWKRFQIIRLVS